MRRLFVTRVRLSGLRDVSQTEFCQGMYAAWPMCGGQQSSLISRRLVCRHCDQLSAPYEIETPKEEISQFRKASNPRQSCEKQVAGRCVLEEQVPVA
jgi:hypothetical protein